MWLCKSKIWWKRYWQFHCIHKKDDNFKDIAEDVETRTDTSNFELGRKLRYVNEIALSSNDNKRMQSIDSTEIYLYWTSEDLVSDGLEEIKKNNIIKRLCFFL